MLNVHEAEERLLDYLNNGIAAEVLWADEAYALVQEIGRHAEEINNANFGSLFGSLQAILSDRQTLCIAKLFDPPSPVYPTRSIPAVLSFLESNATLWSLPDRTKLHEELARAGADTTYLEQLSNLDLTHAVVAHFRTRLPGKLNSQSHLTPSLEALRESRNKVIAHNEAVNPVTRQRPTWNDATSLLNYAKHFVITIGRGFLNFQFEINGQYMLTDAAHGNSRALNRLLHAANLAPDRRRSRRDTRKNETTV